MRKGHGVGFYGFVGQAIIGQMGFKSLDNSLVIWFSPGGRFGCSPNLRRAETRREDQPETMRFSSDNPLIKNGIFEASPRQTRNRLIHITGVVKYGDNRSHESRYGEAIVTKRVSVARYFRLSQTGMQGRRQLWVTSSSSKGAQKSKLSFAICINYDVEGLADSNSRSFLAGRTIGTLLSFDPTPCLSRQTAARKRFIHVRQEGDLDLR
jgi:hypothetical protein